MSRIAGFDSPLAMPPERCVSVSEARYVSNITDTNVTVHDQTVPIFTDSLMIPRLNCGSSRVNFNDRMIVYMSVSERWEASGRRHDLGETRSMQWPRNANVHERWVQVGSRFVHARRRALRM